MSNPDKNFLSYVAQVTAGYLSHNKVETKNIPEVIRQVYEGLSEVHQKPDLLADRPPPAVPINKSITPDYLVCLEDGKKLKLLKRHLKTAYKMTPDDYRKRWGLPRDYPMVAPNYAKKRSSLAKDIGLGKN